MQQNLFRESSAQPVHSDNVPQVFTDQTPSDTFQDHIDTSALANAPLSSVDNPVIIAPDPVDNLPAAIENTDSSLYLDEDGSLHTTNDEQNMTKLSNGTFAGEPMSDAEFQRRLGDAMVNDDGTWMEEDGGLRIDGDGENLTQVKDGSFAGEPMSDAEFQRRLGDAMVNDDGTWMEEDGGLRIDENSENLTKVREGTFANPLFGAVSVPSGHSDQWYKKNPDLLSKEVVFMRKKHPKAKYGFYPTSGDMFWRIELKVGQGLQPWTVLLRYDKDHPNNNHYGGSIKVIPMKPSFEEIQRQAQKAGRRGVPHILTAKNGSEEYRYLCTREPSDVYSGEQIVSSAVMVAAWAAEWAAAFQLGLKRKDVWNKFCGETHFKSLQEH